MREVYKTIGRLAVIDVPALVVGEHGTGKQLVVATIHENSARADRPFRVIDCATPNDAAIEDVLFDDSRGTVQLAQIETLSASLQARLARALGDTMARNSSGDQLTNRVIATSEGDLGALAQAGSFNRELHAALSVVTVKLPPLRERREDVPLLVRHFIQRFNVEFDRAIAGADDRVLAVLQDYSWPGNVAELETVVKRGCILAPSEVITVDEVGDKLGERRAVSRRDAESALAFAARTALQERLVNAPESASVSAYHDIIDVVESTLVQEALKITNGNQVKAAAVLGVNRATLRKKIPDAS
jgi:two-component system nitrogen regulation response regulator GlnG